MDANPSVMLSLSALPPSASLLFHFSVLGLAMATTLVDEEGTEPPDLTNITWSHGTNSKLLLKEAIADDAIDMIEADILMGTVAGGDKTKRVPIMAHPPNETSDLSLEEFLNVVKETLPGGKGVKLDFKSSQAFEASLELITNLFEDIQHDFPIWLNADIQPGPGARDNPGVNATLFLSSCSSKFPTATVSIGWTTKFGTADDKYTSDDIDMMTELLNKNCVIQPVTFAVRAAFAANSHDALVNLIRSSAEATTLTVWSAPDDIVDMDALRKLVADVGKDKVYLDLPQDTLHAFKSSSGNVLSKCALVAATTLLAFGNYHFNK